MMKQSFTKLPTSLNHIRGGRKGVDLYSIMGDDPPALTVWRANCGGIGLASGGGQDKIALAQRLRKETTMSLKWIALRLQRGSWTYVSNLLAAERD
jgi:hypothetical protein